MDWKAFFKSLLGFAIPFIYSWFTSHNPGFPLVETDFVALVIWIVGSAFGGWEALKIRMKLKTGKSYEAFLKS
ncbi:MAG: hypothetical protein OEM46_00645 [Ignavibacteria bacterium]|nr:hypothetical protein [Ignavibacteria bacterium]